MREPSWDRFFSQEPAIVLPVGLVYGLANFAMDRVARMVTQAVTGTVTYWPGVSVLALNMILGVLLCGVLAAWQVFGVLPTDRKPNPLAIYPPAAFIFTVNITGGLLSERRTFETQVRWGVYTLLVTAVTICISYVMAYLRERAESQASHG